jgi:hypothetical protein
VILDSDIAILYGVETKRINEAVKNNPDKFPQGYIIELTSEEWNKMKSKISTSLTAGGKVKLTKAFTEKGLYMIETILKSPRATETTIAIIEIFVKVRELSRNISELQQQEDNTTRQSMLQKSGEIIADIISSDFETTDTETTVELNLAILSIKHTVKRKPKK